MLDNKNFKIDMSQPKHEIELSHHISVPYTNNPFSTCLLELIYFYFCGVTAVYFSK